MEITGAVWNDAAGVIVEGQGTRRQLADLAGALRGEGPAAAVVRDVVEETIPICPAEKSFQIRETVSAVPPSAEVTADLAICPKCAAEIRDPTNARRYRYALTNCTNCGPRFSIIRAIPYDRPNTTMGEFPMCASCRKEYDDPADRRFHAQPTACQRCGPRLELIDTCGQATEGDPIEGAVRRLVDGKIVAIKGIGGFHLAVRADSSAAVARLRELKHRPAKPLALMCASLEAARRLVKLSPRGAQLIASPAAPIVLAPRAPGASVAPAVAPASHRLGVMLAYTPVHCLLFDELGKFGVEALVMTSGNDVDEPLIFNDDEAVSRLGGLCDCVLRHNRPIERAVDDSVVIDGDIEPVFVRRSRGYAPGPIDLPDMTTVAPGLAVGAELKSTVATCRDGQVVLSQHLGNLTQARTFGAFKSAISDLCRLLAVQPRWIAHDLHPIYLSTQHAKRLAAEWNVPLIGVQHHHAHAAAVLAEHGLAGPALAVICDGTGYGTDGSIWGGELLVAELGDFRRVGRLRAMPLPGGDAAAKQPWRSALALLYSAFGEDFSHLPVCATLAEESQVEFVRQMLLNGISCVSSSSTGRLFDGVAALLGLCRVNRFDAEAPAALEAAAAQSDGTARMPEDEFKLRETDGLIEIDPSALVQRLAFGASRQQPAADLAMLFHRNLASAWAAAVGCAMRQTGLNTVVLSGGVFCNELFSDLLGRRLERLGARVLRQKQIPPNDGGIAFGQAAVASACVKGRLACV
jgi:hydrogenase maturation protein HypF